MGILDHVGPPWYPGSTVNRDNLSTPHLIRHFKKKPGKRPPDAQRVWGNGRIMLRIMLRMMMMMVMMVVRMMMR